MLFKYQQFLKENNSLNIWYHGTPDGRGIVKDGFSQNTKSVEYLKDIEGYKDIMNQLEQARIDGKDKYFEILDKISDFKDNFTFNKPIFLSNNYRVASTYATEKRAFDYQESIPKVFKMGIKNEGKVLTIYAHNKRFRFIDSDFIKKGLMDGGISSEKAEETISKFNFFSRKDGISTDTIGAIATYLGFDTVDVVGVLDSYHGGTVKSTVRMVFDSKNIEILN